MAETTEIAWCDATFNPWQGCSKIAPGCQECYAAEHAKRYNTAVWGPHGTRVKTSESYWRQPLKWNRDAEREGVRRRVFCASLADVFEDWYGPINDHKGNEIHFGEDALPTNMDFLRHAVFGLIDQTPWLDWLLLTKRPENIRRMIPCVTGRRDFIKDAKTNVDAWYRPNVWLGTSISDQATADRNVPELLKCGDLCPVLFLSAEPLLGEVNLDANRMGVGPWHDEPWFGGISWVIIGGESGHNARPCNIEWIRNLRDQCRAVGVPCFVKQLGARPRAEVTGRDGLDWPEGTMLSGEDCVPINEFTALATFSLRDKKGGDINEFPEDLRIREFPEP